MGLYVVVCGRFKFEVCRGCCIPLQDEESQIHLSAESIAPWRTGLYVGGKDNLIPALWLLELFLTWRVGCEDYSGGMPEAGES